MTYFNRDRIDCKRRKCLCDCKAI